MLLVSFAFPFLTSNQVGHRSTRKYTLSCKQPRRLSCHASTTFRKDILEDGTQRRTDVLLFAGGGASQAACQAFEKDLSVTYSISYPPGLMPARVD